MVVLSGPKRGIFGHFFGEKLKINFLSIFEGIFFHHVQELFLLGSHAKFQPWWRSGLQVVAVLSGPKSVIFGRFVGVKIHVCVISHNLSLGDGRQIPIGMLNSAWIAVGDSHTPSRKFTRPGQKFFQILS
jgi:hypothetical protein